VLFLRHLNGLLNHRLKHRLYRSSADDDDDSIEEAKDAALASIIKHCEADHGVTYRASKGTNCHSYSYLFKQTGEAITTIYLLPYT